MPSKAFPDTSPSFNSRKAQILAALATPDAGYTDKSPKGSVDSQIRDLIAEINAVDGWVTTSSCSGRVAVFAEGDKNSTNSRDEYIQTRGEDSPSSFEILSKIELDSESTSIEPQKKRKEVPAGPGGKGHGGRWLFVSHDPISTSDQQNGSNVTNDDGKRDQTLAGSYFTDLFGLGRSQQLSQGASASQPEHIVYSGVHPIIPNPNLRLIRLLFSPLILHVLCASLHHARPLLSAAINAGFRESGVQSLKALEDPDAGVMVAIRTAGLGFETTVGFVRNTSIDEDNGEVMEVLVGEQYLQMCVGVVNERFAWNDLRRERLRDELKKVLEAERRGNGYEDKDVRRMRKREDGLKRREEMQKPKVEKTDITEENFDIVRSLDIG